MWDKTFLESFMEDALKKQFPGLTSEDYISRYTTAKEYLINNVYDEIYGKEPNLSKHGSSHISNVLVNAKYLLGDDIYTLPGLELYFLCLSILFHDVGMIKGRIGHNDRKKIADIYNAIRKDEPKFLQERALLIKTCEAHCGTAKDLTKDTLKFIEKTENLDGHPVRPRDIAAILRFADELAEGYQRTSSYMDQIHGYDAANQIYHNSAKITNVFIDRGNERVALTYHIDLSMFNEIQKLNEILKFAYRRIIKLDEERGYNKYYTNYLLPFKKTSIKFNFYESGIPLDFELPLVELSDDFPIPGQKLNGDIIIQEKFPQYKIENIQSQLTPQNVN